MKPIVFAIVLACSMAAPALAQNMQHSGHHTGAMPIEAGQGAFAAIQEIVAILEADPNTNWSKVDLNALRTHLVDMNELVLHAVVSERQVPGGLEMTVDGAGRAGEAARRMVPAHARELAMVAGWEAEGVLLGQDAVLTVTATDPAQIDRIRGLGFFGLMASGSHHQPHHLGMARGEMVH